MKNDRKYSLFNYAMFRDALRQLRVICLVSFGILTLFTILVPIGKSINVSHLTSEYTMPAVISVKSSFAYMYLIYMLFAPFVTIYLFSFLTKRNTSDYFHAFPQKRGCIFTTYFMVIAVWLFIMTFGSGIIAAIVYTILSGYLTFSLVTLLWFLLSIFMASLLVTVSILIACQITGTIFTNIVVSGLVIFLPRMLLTSVVGIVTSGSNTLVSDKLLPVLDNKYNLVFNSVYSIFSNYSLASMANLPAIIYTLVLAVLYFLAGRALFIRRRSEAAGNASVNPVLQCIIRVALAMPVCFIPISKFFGYTSGNNSLMTSDLFWCFVCYITAIIIMLVYELISTHKLSRVVKALPSIGILAGVNIAVFIGITAVYNIETSYRPDAGDIEYVQIKDRNSEYNDDYFQRKLDYVKITDDTIKQYISEGLGNTIDNEKTTPDMFYGNDRYTVITAAIKSGFMTKYRNISFSIADFEKFSTALMQCDDVRNVYTRLPVYDKNTISLDVNFTAEEKADLYDTLRCEVKNLDYERWYELLNIHDMSMNLQMNTIVEDQPVVAVIPMTADTPKTLLKYMNYSNTKFSKEKFDEGIDCLKKHIDSNDYYSFVVSDFTDDYTHYEAIYSYTEESTTASDNGMLDIVEDSIKTHYTQKIDSLDSSSDRKLVCVDLYLDCRSYPDMGNGFYDVSFYTYMDNETMELLK